MLSLCYAPCYESTTRLYVRYIAARPNGVRGFPLARARACAPPRFCANEPHSGSPKGVLLHCTLGSTHTKYSAWSSGPPPSPLPCPPTCSLPTAPPTTAPTSYIYAHNCPSPSPCYAPTPAPTRFRRTAHADAVAPSGARRPRLPLSPLGPPPSTDSGISAPPLVFCVHDAV